MGWEVFDVGQVRTGFGGQNASPAFVSIGVVGGQMITDHIELTSRVTIAPTRSLNPTCSSALSDGFPAGFLPSRTRRQQELCSCAQGTVPAVLTNCDRADLVPASSTSFVSHVMSRRPVMSMPPRR